MESNSFKQKTDKNESGFISSPLVTSKPKNFAANKYGSDSSELSTWSKIGRRRTDSMCSNEEGQSPELSNKTQVTKIGEASSYSTPNKFNSSSPKTNLRVPRRSSHEGSTSHDLFELDDNSMAAHENLDKIDLCDQFSWMYIDEAGLPQGPFSSAHMTMCYGKKLLYPELMVKRTDMTSFVILGDLCILFNGDNPFSRHEFDQRLPQKLTKNHRLNDFELSSDNSAILTNNTSDDLNSRKNKKRNNSPKSQQLSANQCNSRNSHGNFKSQQPVPCSYCNKLESQGNLQNQQHFSANRSNCHECFKGNDLNDNQFFPDPMFDRGRK